MRRGTAAPIASALVVGLLLAAAPASGQVLQADSRERVTSPETANLSYAPDVQDDSGTHGSRAARTDYLALASQVALKVNDDSFSQRLQGVTLALSTGGLAVTDGTSIVTPAVAPVGKLSVFITERADMALVSHTGGVTADQVADLMKAGGLITRTGSPTQLLANALREWIAAARKTRTRPTSFAPALIQAGVLARDSVDLGQRGVDLSGVSFSSLEVMLIAAALDRAIPRSSRKPAKGQAASSAATLPRADDPFAPNPQACGDALRIWLRQVSPLVEQVAQSAVSKVAGDAFSQALAAVNLGLGPLATLSPRELREYIKNNAGFLEKSADAISKALSITGALVKVQRTALLYESAQIYVDTPLGNTAEAPIAVAGRDNSGFVPFAAIVGLDPAAAAEYEQASAGLGRALLDNRRHMTDCADVLGVQLPTTEMDTAEDLENFRIKWELQTNKHVQWDVNRWFAGVSYPAKTDWYVSPPGAVGKLKKIDGSQAAHVMYARVPAQDDYTLRPSLYEKRTTEAIATARLDFSQPPNFKLLGDTVANSLTWAPIGLLGTFTDLAIGMFQSTVMPEASASIDITYYAPKCTGTAGRSRERAEDDVCKEWTLSTELVGEGSLVSYPAGIDCRNRAPAPTPIAPDPGVPYVPPGGGGPSVPDPFFGGGPSIPGASAPRGALVPRSEGTCDASFPAGEAVTLIATPAEGYEFDSWQGPGASQCLLTTPQCTLLSDDALSIEAIFRPITLPGISVTVAGSGIVRSSPSGIDCGTACTATFELGDVVMLSATAGEGYEFDSWKGTGTANCAPRVAQCAVAVSGSNRIEAVFVKSGAVRLAVTVSGGGMVTASNFHIYCGSAFSLCQATTPALGEVVVLTAKADDGYTFTGWSGACTGSWTKCSLTMDESTKRTSATFSKQASIYQRVSEAADGTGANGESFCPSMTSDGNKVAFTSYATNLVPGQTGAGIFVKDVSTGAITRVVDQSNEFPDLRVDMGHACPAISPDGRWLTFGAWIRDTSSAAMLADTSGNRYEYSGWIKNLVSGARTRLTNPTVAPGTWIGKRSFLGHFSPDSSSLMYSFSNERCGDVGEQVIVACGGMRRLDLATLTHASVDAGVPDTCVGGYPGPPAISWSFGGGPTIMGSLGAGRYLILAHRCAADGKTFVVFDTLKGSRQSLDPPRAWDGVGISRIVGMPAARYSTILPLWVVNFDTRQPTSRFLDVSTGRNVLELPNSYVEGMSLGTTSLMYAKCDGDLAPAACDRPKVRNLPVGADRNLTSGPRFSGTARAGDFPRIVGASADGRYVIVQSSMPDLVAGDTNDATDIFIVKTSDFVPPG